MQPVQQCTWEWSVRQNLTGSEGKVHKTLWGLWIDVQASLTGRCFSFFFPRLRYLITFKQKYCSCFVRLQLVECWMMQFTRQVLFFFFSPSPSLSVHFACVFHLVGLGRLALNKCLFFFPPTVVSSGSFLSADPFKLSIPFLSFSSPVSLSLFFFHKQEGFTLLLCHPNWLH